MSNEPMTTEQIWELLSAKLRGFLIARVTDEQVADDLLQETFVRIHERLPDLEDQQRIYAWVFQIARNLVVDYYRAKRRPTAPIGEELEATEDEERNLNDLVSGWLPGMITRLPDGYRQAVELFELERLPQQQIADQLGISLSGTKSRIQRGRAKLKAALLDCCSFEQDRRGNVIGFKPNQPEDCQACDDNCET